MLHKPVENFRSTTAPLHGRLAKIRKRLGGMRLITLQKRLIRTRRDDPRHWLPRRAVLLRYLARTLPRPCLDPHRPWIAPHLPRRLAHRPKATTRPEARRQILLPLEKPTTTTPRQMMTTMERTTKPPPFQRVLRQTLRKSSITQRLPKLPIRNIPLSRPVKGPRLRRFLTGRIQTKNGSITWAVEAMADSLRLRQALLTRRLHLHLLPVLPAMGHQSLPLRRRRARRLRMTLPMPHHRLTLRIKAIHLPLPRMIPLPHRLQPTVRRVAISDHPPCRLHHRQQSRAPTIFKRSAVSP